MKIAFKIAIFLQFFAVAIFARAASFVDIPANDRFFAAVESLKNLEIIGGYDDGTFRAANKVQRIEALVMILKTAKIEIAEVENLNLSFSDAKKSDWFFATLQTGISHKIISNGAQFSPARNVNAAEFLKILFSATNVDLSEFQNLQSSPANDVSANAWFAPYFALAKKVGILNLDFEKKLYPEKFLTRGECAEIIYKFLILENGGETQNLLASAEANLIELLIDLKNNEIAAAIGKANSAIFYTKKALEKNPKNKIVIGADKIANGFRNLCIAYKSGVAGDSVALAQNVEWAKMFARAAIENDESFGTLAGKIETLGDQLLAQ